MGYTHYWYTNLNGIPQKNWNAICEDVKKLLSSLPTRSTSAGAFHSDDPLELAFEYVRIDSDGDKDDWKPALEWVWTVLGDEYGLPPALWPLPQTATV